MAWDGSIPLQKLPDISGQKTPENGQMSAFSGPLFKILGNLFVFCFIQPEKAMKFVFHLANIHENVVVLKISDFK